MHSTAGEVPRFECWLPMQRPLWVNCRPESGPSRWSAQCHNRTWNEVRGSFLASCAAHTEGCRYVKRFAIEQEPGIAIGTRG